MFCKDKSQAEIDAARVKAFDSHLALDVLTAGRSLCGTSAGVGMVLSLLSVVFMVKFRQDTVVSGEVVPSGDVYITGGEDDKADITARGGRKRFVIPIGSKERLEKEREKRAKSKGILRTVRDGDMIELFGVRNIWEVIEHTVMVDSAGE